MVLEIKLSCHSSIHEWEMILETSFGEYMFSKLVSVIDENSHSKGDAWLFWKKRVGLKILAVTISTYFLQGTLTFFRHIKIRVLKMFVVRSVV